MGAFRAETPGHREGEIDLPVVAVPRRDFLRRVAVGIVAVVQADGAAEVERGKLVVSCGLNVELELLDRSLEAMRVGSILEGEGIGVVERYGRDGLID